MKALKISKIHLGSATKVGGTLTILLSFVALVVWLILIWIEVQYPSFLNLVGPFGPSDPSTYNNASMVILILIFGPAIIGIWGMFFSFLAALFFNWTIKLTGGLHFSASEE